MNGTGGDSGERKAYFSLFTTTQGKRDESDFHSLAMLRRVTFISLSLPYNHL